MAEGEILEQEGIFDGGEGPQTRYIRAKSIERNRNISIQSKHSRIHSTSSSYQKKSTRRGLTMHFELNTYKQTTLDRKRYHSGPLYIAIDFATGLPYSIFATKRVERI